MDCRYFYCHFYERLVTKEEDYVKLKELINNGYNLNIVGYDGYNVNKDLWIHYNDTKKPFGHELVLYTMLIEPDKEKYPWEHKELYQGVI